MDFDRVSALLSSRSPVYVTGFPELPSTNDHLNRMARGGAPEWTVVAADAQTKGKGRQQRFWHSAPGVGLWFSILLRPKMAPRFLNLVNLQATLTLAEYLESACATADDAPLKLDLKWPNDIWHKGRKVCGMLLEGKFEGMRLGHLVLGVGLNVNHTAADFPEELRETAGSLRIATGKEQDREALLAGFLERFYANFPRRLETEGDAIVERYLKRVLFRGQRVAVDTRKGRRTGVFDGITGDGFLILDVDGDLEHIAAGDVFPLPTEG